MGGAKRRCGSNDSERQVEQYCDVGSSTGANVVAALRLAERLGSEATVVTVMCDTGMKYLKTFGAKLEASRLPA
jgi:hypothetical protein